MRHSSWRWRRRHRLRSLEDVFKGKIIITKNRLPLRFSSEGAFVSALQKGKIDKIWPSEEKGDAGKWNIEYMAFFASRSTTTRSR